MTSNFKSPFQAIPAQSTYGGQLLLRLRDPRHRWLRVHENGDLEVAIGDARRDEHRTYLGTLAQAEPLLAQARELHAELRHNFQADSLLERSVWDHFYPVQAFAGVQDEIVEGYIGIECEMGATTDVFGFRDARNARKSHRTLQALLDLIPNDKKG